VVRFSADTRITSITCFLHSSILHPPSSTADEDDEEEDDEEEYDVENETLKRAPGIDPGRSLDSGSLRRR
jgi:hypothetical protein